MGFLDDQVGKHYGLPAGVLFARRYAQGDVYFLGQVTLQVIGPVTHGEDIVPRYSGIESLQLRNPKSRLGDSTGRNFARKLKVIRIDLLEYRYGAGSPHEVNSACSSVVVEIISAANAIEHLDDFARFRVHHNELSRLALMAASDVARMGDRPASDEQAMMLGVKCRGAAQG